ncbi:hypothetical protein BGX29_006884 [Mortierella sp. GBA35]|nr:hypothetical protein BGX29_006884 [Mortierella sp. GBA35]
MPRSSKPPPSAVEQLIPKSTTGTISKVESSQMASLDPASSISSTCAPNDQGFILAIGGFPATGPGFWSVFDMWYWRNVTITTASTLMPYDELEGQTAAVDPATGLVYVFGGYINATTTAQTTLEVNNLLTVFDPNTTRILSQEAANATTGLTGAVAIWSTIRNTKDGSKIVLHGGAKDASAFLSTMHILDVAMGVWKQGPSTTKCIIFGGSIDPRAVNTLADSTPILYDVDKNEWVSTFKPGPDPYNTNAWPMPDLTNPDHVGIFGPEDPNQQTKILGAIIGGVAGVVVLLMVGLVVYLVRRRRRMHRDNGDKESRDTDAKTAVLEEACKNFRPSAFGGAKSWNSDELSRSVAVSDSNFSAVGKTSKARRLSDPEVQLDPVLYYQQLLMKQRQLQIQHPHLIGDLLSHRSPQSCPELDGSSSSSIASRNNSSNDDNNNEKQGLTI